MPVQHPTCPGFGGSKLDVIHVTCKGLEPDTMAGGIFSVKLPGVSGMAPAYQQMAHVSMDS